MLSIWHRTVRVLFLITNNTRCRLHFEMNIVVIVSTWPVRSVCHVRNVYVMYFVLFRATIERKFMFGQRESGWHTWQSFLHSVSALI